MDPANFPDPTVPWVTEDMERDPIADGEFKGAAEEEYKESADGEYEAKIPAERAPPVFRSLMKRFALFFKKRAPPTGYIALIDQDLIDHEKKEK